MPSLLKSTVLGVGLVTGVALAAQAQSVSSLPPASQGPAQTAITQPYGSTQRLVPGPGGAQTWREDHYQPAQGYASNPAEHPYSTSIGPKPGSQSLGSAGETHASATYSDPNQHPYTAGIGPKPN